jgi:putative endonuclease
MSKTSKQIIGTRGEEKARQYLINKGFKVIETNYWQKWGEIDIVAKKSGVWHFVEVKTVTRTRESLAAMEEEGDYEPEDNLHPWKLKRLGRTVETYLLDRRIGDDEDWQIDAILVYLSPAGEVLKIDYLPEII